MASDLLQGFQAGINFGNSFAENRLRRRELKQRAEENKANRKHDSRERAKDRDARANEGKANRKHSSSENDKNRTASAQQHKAGLKLEERRLLEAERSNMVREGISQQQVDDAHTARLDRNALDKAKLKFEMEQANRPTSKLGQFSEDASKLYQQLADMEYSLQSPELDDATRRELSVKYDVYKGTTQLMQTALQNAVESGDFGSIEKIMNMTKDQAPAPSQFKEDSQGNFHIFNPNTEEVRSINPYGTSGDGGGGVGSTLLPQNNAEVGQRVRDLMRDGLKKKSIQ